MDLIIGGYAANKLTYALEKLNNENESCDFVHIYDENDINLKKGKTAVINHFHLIVKKYGKEQSQILINKAMEEYSRLVVISDEIGNGIVPLEKSDRKYRDDLGELLIDIAKSAKSVERIICQIPQKIK